MKIKFKKIIFSFLVGALVFSCSGLTAKEKYERGDYIGALESTAEELLKNKNSIPSEIENEIIFRIKEIENRYRMQTNQMDERSLSFAYFNIWNMGYVIEKNPVLQKYTDFLIRNDNFKNLISSVENMKKYINYDINNRITSFDELLRKFKQANVKNSSYSNIYEEFARYGADIYIDKAKSFENFSKLEEARNLYFKAIKAMEDFSSNYRDSAKRYNLISLEIDINNANRFFEEGISLYNSNRFENARTSFENAKNLYLKHNMTKNVSQINTFLSDINRRIELNDAIRNFDNAKRLYNSNRFEQARVKFENAKKVFNYYGNYTLVREIEVYLENIRFKSAIFEADKFFIDAEKYYNNRQYKIAKDLFEKSLKIYQSINERKNIHRINVYLENINLKLNDYLFNDERDYEKYFSRGLDSYNKAEKSYNLDERNFYYKKAIEDFKEALRYTKDFRRKDELKNYITDSENKIFEIKDKKDDFFNFQKNRLEALNKLTFADSFFNKKEATRYYKEALELFKKALSFTRDNKEINEIKKYISEIDEKIILNSMNFDDVYKKAKELMKIGDTKIKVEETNYYYSEAIKYFEIALKLTNNYDKRYEITNTIKDLKNRIF